MSEISVQASSRPNYIPQELPDKPGPKLVSAKGKVERLVVVLTYGDDLYAQTMNALDDGNVPVLMDDGRMLSWTGSEYVGVCGTSDTSLVVAVVYFDTQHMPNSATYSVAMVSNNPI